MHICTGWHHQVDTFSMLLALCARYSLVTGEFPSQRPVTWGFDVLFDLHLNKQLGKQLSVNSPHKSQWHRALMFSLICTWTNSWVNNQDASDLRCHHAPYDATVMISKLGQHSLEWWTLACSVQVINLTHENNFLWNFNQNTIIAIQKMDLTVLSAKWWPFCFGLNVLTSMVSLSAAHMYWWPSVCFVINT